MVVTHRTGLNWSNVSKRTMATASRRRPGTRRTARSGAETATAAAAAARSSLEAATAARQQNARVKVCKLIIGTAFVMLALDSMHISYGAAIMWAVLFLLILVDLVIIQQRTSIADEPARWACDRGRQTRQRQGRAAE